MNRIDGVKFSTILRVVNILEKSGMRKDSEVSFEFIVGSLFPHAFKNMQTALRTEYTKGYAAGLKAKESE